MQTSRRGAHLGIAAAIIVFLTSVLLLAWPPNGAPQGVAIGRPAPDWHAQDLRGRLVSSDITDGRFTVLFFTSARCPLANSHTPRVRELAAQYTGDSRVQFLAVYSGLSETLERDEIRVLERVLDLPFRSLIDESGELASRFGQPQVLSYFIIDPDGILRQSGSFRESPDEQRFTHPTCDEALQQLLHASAGIVSTNFALSDF